MEVLTAELGVDMGDKKALRAAVTKDGKIDTEALKAGCYLVDNHFKALKEDEKKAERKADKKAAKQAARKGTKAE